jgi:hypothetical protein
MLLQYPVQFHLFRDHGRLNPDVPLEEAGDCGANTLLLLGLIKLDKATELSRKQNICWLTKSGKEFTPRYLLKKYLFKDSSKQYEVIECTQKELMIEVQELRPGYGTFLYMEDKTHFGHFTCIYKNEETGEIELADLQTEEIIKNENYDPNRIDDYLSQYDLFYIPSIESQVRHSVDSPVRRSQSRQTSKSTLMYSHGSPAKTIPTEREQPYRSPEKVTRPGYEQPIESTPELIRSRRDPLSIENINAFERRVEGESERHVSPFTTPKAKRPRIGGKQTMRKRKTRKYRKN